MELADVSVTTDSNGVPTITVNGEAVDGVVAVTIRSQVGETPVVGLYRREGSTAFSGQGVVEIETDSSGVGAVDFLSAIDPESLEERALNRLGLEGDFDGSLTKAMLATLIGWAKGES